MYERIHAAFGYIRIGIDVAPGTELRAGIASFLGSIPQVMSDWIDLEGSNIGILLQVPFPIEKA